MLSLTEQFKGKLKEVFLYITYRCNLKCLHCYLGDSKRQIDMPINDIEPLLRKSVSLGASKITFLGGEPTLHPLFPQFINIAKVLGFNYLRLDTNGQFNSAFLENSNLKFLNGISFSLDGIDPLTHGTIRSARNYYSVINNIKRAIELGYTVRVTMTINSLNLSQVEEMTQRMENMGVSVLNLHLVSNNGRARDNKWLFVEEEKWMEFTKKILPRLAKYNIKVRIAKRYMRESELNLENETTCEAAKFSRLIVTPDLKIYACSLLLDSERYFAYFQKGEFIYSKNYQNNIFLENMVKRPICPLLMKENYKRYKRKKILPICISCKQTNKDNQFNYLKNNLAKVCG